MEIKKNINYYLKLPWTYSIETAYKDNRPYYVIRVNELPGVVTDAPTLEEAMQLIQEAMIGVFECYLEDGEEIPEPDQSNSVRIG